MRIGIISDIHGNLEALQATLLFLDGKIDCLAVTGDIIGYGPDPEECVELLLERAEIVVKGNHEEGVLSKNLLSFKDTARVALEWTMERLPVSCVDKLKGLLEIESRDDMLFVHASISSPLFRYLLRKEDAEEEFAIFDKKICFFGHTHMPGAFTKRIEENKIEVLHTDFSGRLNIKIEEGVSYLVNIGSVGQPRDGFPFACATIYDSERYSLALHRIEYPVEITRKKIIERGLPSVLARRIMQGI